MQALRNAARHRIVLVEDNPADADIALEWLEAMPESRFDVVQVATLSEATEALADSPPDVVLLDLNLPDSWGIETIRSIRRVAQDVPVIVLSGVADEELVTSALAEGVDEVLGKNDLHRRSIALSALRSIDRASARTAQRRLEQILDATPDALLIVDRDHVVRYANRAAADLYDTSPGRLVGRAFDHVLDAYHPTEITIPRPGDDRTCEMRVVPTVWNREPCNLATLRDVTENKRLEKQLLLSDRMASIGVLAAGVAHEINNPLAAIIGNLDLARRLTEADDAPPLPDNLAERLADARAAADQVRAIVRDLRLFSRSDDSRLQQVDLHLVLETTLRMARGEIRYRARVLKDFATPITVLSNESRLGQVFLNLLVNAAQSMPEGDVDNNEIRIATSRIDGERAMVTISDTGCGIPLEAQRSIFTPFFTTKAPGVGTGLGLAICHRIVGEMGGEIGFDSRPGVGTSFRVMLPLSRHATAPEPKSRPDAAARVLARREDGEARARILVIDDDPAIARIAASILEPLYEVVTMARAREALGVLEKGEAFDLVLCDLMMPDLSGQEFHARASAIGDDVAGRIVFLSGGAFTRSAREFLKSVPNETLEKPFDSDDLIEAVERALA